MFTSLQKYITERFTCLRLGLWFSYSFTLIFKHIRAGLHVTCLQKCLHVNSHYEGLHINFT